MRRVCADSAEGRAAGVKCFAQFFAFLVGRGDSIHHGVHKRAKFRSGGVERHIHALAIFSNREHFDECCLSGTSRKGSTSAGQKSPRVTTNPAAKRWVQPRRAKAAQVQIQGRGGQRRMESVAPPIGRPGLDARCAESGPEGGCVTFCATKNAKLGVACGEQAGEDAPMSIDSGMEMDWRNWPLGVGPASQTCREFFLGIAQNMRQSSRVDSRVPENVE